MMLVLGFVPGTLTEFTLVHISDNPLPTLLPSCSKRAPKVHRKCTESAAARYLQWDHRMHREFD